MFARFIMTIVWKRNNYIPRCESRGATSSMGKCKKQL